VTGYTGSLDFPMLNALQSAYGGGTSDAVALKFTAAGTLAWSTYLGGNGADVGVGIAVDGAGGAYVTGNTSSTNFPIVNSFQSTYHGAGDAFVSGFTAAGNMLSYSSYFGGSGAETAHAIAVQCAVGTVIAGKTASSDLPVTAGVVQSSLQGASAGFVARIAAGTSVPSITSGGVVNSATFTAPVAPGSLISVFGKNLAAATATPSGSLTTNLGGASVMITGNGGASGFAAPVLYSSIGQLNVQLPFEITSGTASIVANSCAGPSPVITFQVAAVSPSIFPYGAGAAIVNLSGGVNSSTNPATRGSYVSVFLTGIGPVTNQPATGALAPSSPLASASSSYSAQIGNTAATVQFLGLAPGFAGLAQANILIPTSISPGAQPLQITVGNSVSNTVQVYVQ
jgi:uncharacterized protein (TIGR03437 family)